MFHTSFNANIWFHLLMDDCLFSSFLKICSISQTSVKEDSEPWPSIFTCSHEWALGQWGIFKYIINQWQNLKKYLFIMSIIYTDIIYNQQSPSTENDNGDCKKIWKIVIEIKNLPKILKIFYSKFYFFRWQDQ